MKRKDFLSSLIGIGISSSLPRPSKDNHLEIEALIKQTTLAVRGDMMDHKDDPIPKVRIGMVGLGNRGQTLTQMCQFMIEEGSAEITALCDLDEKKVSKARASLGEWQDSSPMEYHSDENAWKDMITQEDLDLLVIATPWDLHAEMCIQGMQAGRHVACEVPIAFSLTDGWRLIQTAEETRRHCIMLENCCYNGEELWVFNMIQKGVFGDLTHAEGAYLHDLRAHMLSTDYYQGQWRLHHHIDHNGNLYTTHGLGPIAMYMDIARGDTFSHLTSMSSRELNLSIAAKKADSPVQAFACGDMNTTMIRTEKGKTIMLQFDTHTGQPYSRINKVVGTKAVHHGYPSRLYLDSEELAFSGHRWLDEEAYTDLRKKYDHPLVGRMKETSLRFKQGHGGMDFIMMYRLVHCLNKGLPLDFSVYDGVMWSMVTPMSELSVASRSSSLTFPDFTGGAWKKERKHPLAETS